MVESDPDDPTYRVSSKLTLEVSRSDDNSFITCAVDHATLTSGNKKSAQSLRVLCESKREGVGARQDAVATNGNFVCCVVLKSRHSFLFYAVHFLSIKV